MTSVNLDGLDYSVVAFFCDTVRSEVDNKFTLVGIGPGTVHFPVFPFLVTLGIYSRITPSPPAGTMLGFSITFEGENLLVFPPSATPEDTSDETDINRGINAALDGIALTIPRPGIISLSIHLGDAPVVEISSARYSLMQNAPHVSIQN